MKLSGRKIAEEIEAGRIVIDPFDKTRVGPNSYDLTLGSRLMQLCCNTQVGSFAGEHVDPKLPLRHHAIEIGEEGFVLYPGHLYLASTIERAGSTHYVPAIQGRSSLARLGLFTHVCAGFGDVGFTGNWTLELVPVLPIKVYPRMRLVQVYFDTVDGDYEQYQSEYNGASDRPKSSKLATESDEWKLKK
jgi:dCTP deaminase